MSDYNKNIEKVLKTFWKDGDVLFCEKYFSQPDRSCGLCGRPTISLNFRLKNMRSGEPITVCDTCIRNLKGYFKKLGGDGDLIFPTDFEKVAASINKKSPGSVRIDEDDYYAGFLDQEELEDEESAFFSRDEYEVYLEEMEDEDLDTEGWARSDEDGWFYDDEDDEEF